MTTDLSTVHLATLKIALEDGVAAPAQQIHHHGPQEREHRCAGSVGVAVGILAELGVAGPVPFVFDPPALANPAQQGFWGCAQAHVAPRGALQ